MNKEEILHKLQKENPHSIPTFKAMDEYAKQQAIAFVVFRQDFQREESRKVREEQKRLGGMFTWVGRSDEEIYDQFIESQNNNNK